MLATAVEVEAAVVAATVVGASVMAGVMMLEAAVVVQTHLWVVVMDSA